MAGGAQSMPLLMRLVDILFGLPYILLVVLLAVAVDGLLIQREGADLGSAAFRQFVNVHDSAGGDRRESAGWRWRRVIRGQVLSLREQPFIEAAQAGRGPGPSRQFLLHLLPNLMGPNHRLCHPGSTSGHSLGELPELSRDRSPGALCPAGATLLLNGLSELNTVKSRWWLLLWPCALIGSTLLALNFLWVTTSRSGLIRFVRST